MLYKNKDTGELLNYCQMREQFRLEYDGEDPTNPIEWTEKYEQVPGTLKERLTDAAETLGWSVDWGKLCDDKCVEFSIYSNAGEDFSVCVMYKEIEDVPKGVEKYYDSFDSEEHITMWIMAKKNGVSGVPTIKELVQDAEEIDYMLKSLSDSLYDEYDKWKESGEKDE